MIMVFGLKSITIFMVSWMQVLLAILCQCGRAFVLIVSGSKMYTYTLLGFGGAEKIHYLQYRKKKIKNMNSNLLY
jgi:hypothetical protein